MHACTFFTGTGIPTSSGFWAAQHSTSFCKAGSQQVKLNSQVVIEALAVMLLIVQWRRNQGKSSSAMFELADVCSLQRRQLTCGRVFRNGPKTAARLNKGRSLAFIPHICQQYQPSSCDGKISSFTWVLGFPIKESLHPRTYVVVTSEGAGTLPHG